MKNEEFLKGTGILMILGGAIAILTAISMIIQTVTLTTDAQASMLCAAALLMLVCGFEAIVAGYAGVKHSTSQDKTSDFVAWGIIVAVLGLGGTLLGAAVMGSVNVVSLVFSVLLPVLYIMGASSNRQGSASPLTAK